MQAAVGRWAGVGQWAGCTKCRWGSPRAQPLRSSTQRALDPCPSAARLPAGHPQLQIGYATVFFWEYLGPLLVYPLFYLAPRLLYPGLK